jgi:hypothetical protein
MSSIEEKGPILNCEADSPVTSDTRPGSDYFSGFPTTLSPRSASGTTNDSSLPETVPPHHAHRTLVLCFDGTGALLHDTQMLIFMTFLPAGDQFDDDVSVYSPLVFDLSIKPFVPRQNSNIVNFLSMLKKDSPQQQMVYYQARFPFFHAAINQSVELLTSYVILGRNRNLHHPTDSQTNDGKIAQNHGQHGRGSSERPCHG